MPDRHAPTPGGGSSSPEHPPYEKCGRPMVLVLEIALLTEPGWMRMFECSDCRATAFRHEKQG
jgi:hypothetical protein